MEENHIDIKVKKPNGEVDYYEVKSDSYASLCIRNALGQIMEYAFWDKDEPHKYKLIVVGQYPPFKNDLKYINFVKGLLKVEFEYRCVRLSK